VPRAESVTPFVRVRRLEPEAIRVVLDMRALGVVVPEVESPADVEAAVWPSKLPADGKRRVGLCEVDEDGARHRGGVCGVSVRARSIRGPGVPR